MSLKASEINEKTRWQDLTEGLNIFEPATSRGFLTGEWRTQTPVVITDKCRQCYMCVPYCPDSSIIAAEPVVTIDYDHCKGCGICSKVCPFHAIEMREGK